MECVETDHGHRERLRKKFLEKGLSGFHDYEMLELLLTFAIKRRDVKPLAKRLLAEFKDFSGVFDADPARLRKVKGVGEQTAVLLTLLKELCAEYLAARMTAIDVISSPEAVVDFARVKLGGRKKESFVVVFLNTKNHVIAYDMYPGTVDRAAVYPREVIRRALELHALSLIAIHNHPSGECDPSHEDVQISRALKKAAEAVGIRLLDHVIVSKTSHRSLAASTLI